MINKILYSTIAMAAVALTLGGAQSSTPATHSNKTTKVHAVVDHGEVNSAVNSLNNVQALQLSAPANDDSLANDTDDNSAVNQNNATAVSDTQSASNTASSETTTKAVAAPVVTPVSSVATPTAPAKAAGGNLQWLIERESGGNPNAQNGSMHGIGQLSESAYATYAPGQDYRGNYDVQLSAMQGYIADRYGSVDNAVGHFQSNGWY